MDIFDKPVELEIIRYQDNGDYHVCRAGGDKRTINIDLLTDGTIPIPKDCDYVDFCKGLVGKKVKIDYSHTYLHMAANPQIVGA